MHRVRRLGVGLGLVVLGGSLSMVPPSPAAGAAAPAATVNDCWPTDNGDPRLTGITLFPRSLRLGSRPGVVHVTATAEDTGGPGPASGVASVAVGLTLRGGAVTGAALLRRSPADGAWHGSYVVAPGISGTLKTREVRIRDRVGNETFVDMRGGAASVTIDSPADTRRPRLRSLTVRPSRVDTRRGPATVRVRVHLTDDVGIVGGVGASLVHAEVSSTSGLLHPRSGSARDRVFTGRLTIPPGHPGRWRVAAIGFRDGAHPAGLNEEQLRRLGDVPSVLVVDRRDTSRPSASAPRVAPSSVDTRVAAQTVTVSVRARDRDSGVGLVEARVRSGPEVPVLTRLRLTTGTRQNGIWSGRVVVSRCGVPPGNLRVAFRVLDRAGRDSTGGITPVTVPLQVTAIDNVRPSASSPDIRLEPGGAGPHVDFTEDVQGVTPETLRVSVQAPDTGSPSALPGTWSCTGIGGAAEDCATGRVRRATYTPSPPLVAPAVVQIEANPEHTLGLTDLAGNPMRPRLVIINRVQ